MFETGEGCNLLFEFENFCPREHSDRYFPRIRPRLLHVQEHRVAHLLVPATQEFAVHVALAADFGHE